MLKGRESIQNIYFKKISLEAEIFGDNKITVASGRKKFIAGPKFFNLPDPTVQIQNTTSNQP